MLIRGLILTTNRTPYTPSTTTVTTPGTSNVNVPAGALDVEIECIAGGSAGSVAGLAGGGGGAYSKKTKYAIGSVTTYYVSCGAGGATDAALGADSFVRDTNVGGTLRCLAKAGVTNFYAGGLAASGTGDTKYSGGSGVPLHGGGGGGAAGPSGNGSDNVYDTQTGGASGGSPGGAGGDGVAGPGTPTAGSNYGGGGARSNDNFSVGAGGYVKFSWT